ncbi:MAG: CDP-glycerol glycerophosphotransferase family protein, partial [Prevotella sp.]|nr:CDP-glycerol glycerophosphotransferase family protein [Prevotella sp.]
GFRDILTVFVSYAFPNTKHISMGYDLLLHNLVWRRYVEHPLEEIDAKKISRNHGSNIIYSGYPGIDRFIKNEENYSDVWILKNRNVKRIIWAPHHTITDYAFVSYSTFLDYHDFMLEMAHKYDGQIQIAFKPHPLLKNRLDLIWGEDRTKEYYKEWNNLQNGLLNDGAYEDLFMTSDAIIHDSGSFIGEYLFTRKPAMYLSNGRPFNEQYNQLAQKCLDNYYIGRSKEDIEKFIIDVIEGKDPLKEKREIFDYKELLPPNGKLASENIMDDLIKELRSI